MRQECIQHGSRSSRAGTAYGLCVSHAGKRVGCVLRAESAGTLIGGGIAVAVGGIADTDVAPVAMSVFVGAVEVVADVS